MNDIYALKARLYPMLLFFLPLFTTLISFFFLVENYQKLFFPAGVISALSFLLSQLGRDAGKKKQNALWIGWGGAPCEQLLSYRNGVVNKTIKKRYHDKLSLLHPQSSILSEAYETRNPDSSQEIYGSWVKYLISKTRDTTRFHLLYKENINYGFRRNLWGMKPYSIFLILFLLVASYFYCSRVIGFSNPLLFSAEYLANSIFLIVALFFWIFIVSEHWVKLTAFSYAERLLET